TRACRRHVCRANLRSCCPQIDHTPETPRGMRLQYRLYSTRPTSRKDKDSRAVTGVRTQADKGKSRHQAFAGISMRFSSMESIKPYARAVSAVIKLSRSLSC